MKAPVHVAGVGVISAIGTSVSETERALRTQTSGIGAISLFDSVHRGVLPVGEVKLSDTDLAQQLSIAGNIPRTALLGIYAARQAVQQAGINLKDWRTGLISATTVGGMDRTENFFTEFSTDQQAGKLRDVVYHNCGSSTELMAEDLGIHQFITTINTACSSSVNSIMLGSRMIRQGMLDIVIAGGTDALTRFTLNGFNSLMILDKELCRPFDANRKGLNLGEGAGYVVLMSDAVKRSLDKPSLATIAGYANTNDAFHQTASSPDGRGSYAAMQQALAMAGLGTADINYINLHGTGTQNNDASEGTAIRRLFENRIPPLSSTKAYTGHTLGASGGVEAVFSIMALRNQCVFPNLRFETPMPETNIVPQQVFEETVVNHVMSNAFGFGGNCSSIIFSKANEL